MVRVPFRGDRGKRPAVVSPLIFLLAFACGPAAREASQPEKADRAAPVASVTAPVLAPEPAAIELRTGRLEPKEGQAIDVEAAFRHVAGGVEYLQAVLPPVPISGGASTPVIAADWVRIESSEPALGFIAPDARGAASLWVRRRASAEPVRGFVYTPATPMRFADGSVPGHRFSFTVRVGVGTKADPKLETIAYERLAENFDFEATAFSVFAAARLRGRTPADRGPESRGGAGTGDPDLAPLMDTMTGRLSVQLALQAQRALHLSAARQKPTTPIEKVAPPRLERHDWARLRGSLGRPSPDEPLARATPAAFYYVRARELEKLLDVLDLVDDWAQPAVNVLDGRTEERGTFTRYQTELGLTRTGLTRLFGPALVADLAIVGSDPYVNEGTDVTLVIRPKNAAGLGAALAAVLAQTAEGHGALTETTFVHEGVPVMSRRSADGRVLQHRATADGLELVSNSPGAIRRVISAALGKEPRLSDELDFLYMLARDAGAGDDVLGYLGERFIDAVVGPRQKIAEARRQLAVSELMVPGFAALLYGLVEGKSPASKEDLMRGKWLLATELSHVDGASIEWQPGQAARSKWGTVEAQEPLIDLPEPKRVTQSEAESYRRFASEYEQVWSDAIDPVALRLKQTRDGDRTALAAELRVLPLLRREYRDFTELVGRAGVVLPDLARGARIVAAIGKDAQVRRELSGLGREFGLTGKLTFDWLGDWVMVGAANRNEIANTASVALARDLEPPGDRPSLRGESVDELLGDLPVYAAIGIRSRLGASAVITALRKLAEDALGGVAWDADGSYRGQKVIRVTPEERRARVALYYSLLDTALVVSLSEAGLKAAIDQILDAPPRASDASPGPAGRVLEPSADQVVLELAGDPRSALHRIGVWLSTRALLANAGGGRALAEAVLRGAPDAARDPAKARALMRAYLGTVIVTPEGRDYRLALEGVSDPLRGTFHAPEWPRLPVPGSIVDRALGRLVSVRTGISFDLEPGAADGRPLESLRARARFTLGPRAVP